jgi:hypothetical protein
VVVEVVVGVGDAVEGVCGAQVVAQLQVQVECPAAVIERTIVITDLRG